MNFLSSIYLYDYVKKFGIDYYNKIVSFIRI